MTTATVPAWLPNPAADQIGVLLERVREAGLPAQLGGGRASAAPPRQPRRDGLPDRPGGADQRAALCPAGRDPGSAWRPSWRSSGSRIGRRWPDGALQVPVTAPAGGSWGMARTGGPGWADASKPAHGSAAATRCAPGCRSEARRCVSASLPDRPGRRRSGPRPGRVQDDPRGATRHPGRGGGAGRRCVAIRLARRHAPDVVPDGRADAGPRRASRRPAACSPTAGMASRAGPSC